MINKFIPIFVLSVMVLASIIIYASDDISILDSPNKERGNIKLLTVAVGGDEDFKGGTADLFLEVRKGSGKIFIDSFPLTKLDTQISTRFANEIACSLIDVDCSKYDFFYTIRSQSSIVGGPSAGAAISILTISMLLDIPLDPDVAITGTINSGALIGVVAGVKEKAIAAERSGLKKVLAPAIDIPSNLRSNTSNETITNETGEKIYNEVINIPLIPEKDPYADVGIPVVQVLTLEDAFYEFTGHQLNNIDDEIIIQDYYTDRMELIANSLCQRTINLNSSFFEIDSISKTVNEDISFLEENSIEIYGKKLTQDEIRIAFELFNHSNERYQNAIQAVDESKHYSAASFCFSSNVDIQKIRVMMMDEYKSYQLYHSLADSIHQMEDKISNRKLETLSDLETYMIVKERLQEADLLLSNMSPEDLDPYKLGYAVERFQSAVSWSEFFGLDGTKFEINRQSLRNGCVKKISEVEDRLNFVDLYAANALQDTRRDLDQAYENLESGYYELCLFSASKAKAQVDVLLSSLAVSRSQVDDLLNQKLDATEKVILKQQNKGIFPIMGYSYYEYANELKEIEPMSSLTFAEYALELSNLELYFPKKPSLSIDFDWELVLFNSFILILGIFLGVLIIKKDKPKQKNIKAKKVKTKSKKKAVKRAKK